MYDIPKGFMDKALKEVQRGIYSDLNNGARLSDDHYLAMFADSLWSSYIIWKNQDSARGDYLLKVRDIAMGCRTRGIDYKLYDSDIFVFLDNLTYCFSSSNYHSHGGPVDRSGVFLGFSLDMNFSSKALFRFLKWFDKAMEGMDKKLEKLLDSYCRQYKRAQILQSTAPFTLEPGLEDLNYRYSFSADDDKEFLNVWLYYEVPTIGFDEVVRLTFPYSEFVEDPRKVKNIIRGVSRNFSYHQYYKKWATDVSDHYDEYPEYNTVKSAGVCINFNV